MVDWWAISVDNFCIGIVNLVQFSACDRGESNLEGWTGIWELLPFQSKQT